MGRLGLVLLGAISCMVILSSTSVQAAGILQPRATVTREVLSLDGLWNFRKIKNATGLPEENDFDLDLMPVPSSYNDISTSRSLRNYVGPVYYSRKFFIPTSWAGKRVWIRFGSVCYAATVTINNNEVLSHTIGHLPFSAEITHNVDYGAENEITVAVDNTLNSTTIPQGTVTTSNTTGVKSLTYTYDFYHYVGIDRPVVLYTTSQTYVDDITLRSKVNDDNSAEVNYDLSIIGLSDSSTLRVSVLDKLNKVVVQSNSSKLSDKLSIANATLWWPIHMSKEPGYQYTFKVDVLEDNKLVDSYNLLFGIRELTWDNTTFKINGKKVYFRGFGRHEDSDLRGKGLDLPLIIRDHNLIKWIGANAYRTSHYPYAEEIMDLADQLGIMIIDESPAVNMEQFSDNLLENHKRAITEMINRDKNRPSVVLWSSANEPRTNDNRSGPYFKQIVAHVKSLDTTRPVTHANFIDMDKDHAVQYVDIISFNRYEGWYIDPGHPEEIYPKVIQEAQNWHKMHQKPVLTSEYGAECLEGLHFLPLFIWSEEYQQEVMSYYFRAFDYLRENNEWFIGEFIWNFADFKTDESEHRVGGNKKGIFTRNRQPKSSAFLMRRRYWALAQKLDNATIPTDLNRYVTN